VKNSTWKKVETDLKPTPRVGHSMVASTLEPNIYVIGGSRGDYGGLKEIWQFLADKEVWKQVEYHLPSNQPITNPYTIPAKHSSAVMIGPKIVMFGGETLMKDLKIEPFLSDFLVYDTETKELTRCGDSNEDYGLRGHNLIWWNDKFLLLGGATKKIKHYASLIPFDEAMCGKTILTGKTFNVSLEHSMKRPENKNKTIPLIIEETVDYLNEEGFDAEGIFRKSGRHSDVIYLNAIFENGLKFEKNRFKDPNAVSVVLKRYLTSLPEPILTYKLYEEFMAAMHKENMVDELRMVIAKLPQLQFDVSKKIFSLLYKVQQNIDTTFMGSKNLIIILGPYLLGCKDPSTSNVKDKEKSPLPFLIENYPLVWEYFDDLKKEVKTSKEEITIQEEINVQEEVNVIHEVTKEEVDVEEIDVGEIKQNGELKMEEEILKQEEELLENEDVKEWLNDEKVENPKPEENE
jgi:hypothetical protein